jgi:hypothetical protein
MMYVLCGWTGSRKGEIGSLTLRSLDLGGESRRRGGWPRTTARIFARTRRFCIPNWYASYASIDEDAWTSLPESRVSRKDRGAQDANILTLVLRQVDRFAALTR